MNEKTDSDNQQGGGTGTFMMLVYALLFALVLRTFAYESFNIPSASMVPNLLIGDFLFVSKYSYGYGSKGTFFGLIPFKGRLGGEPPQRGDVIVFKLPKDPRIDYIKRLVGLPGDTIQVKSGVLHINGLPVDITRVEGFEKLLNLTDDDARLNLTDRKTGKIAPSGYFIELLPEGISHIIRKEDKGSSLDNTELFIVPEGHYFFMGDNRDQSQDSRTPMVGFVPEENLVGKAKIIFFSLRNDTRFWEVWKWYSDVRWGRLFKKID
ncbi:MAG: signal peptidase I [Alphaproteobacteria bacterium]|nr:signal peptidase I [Alphaproteobacteria bacterium]MCL2506034.1 signal peptidase I [Alphaproteobacteria bacterium]